MEFHIPVTAGCPSPQAIEDLMFDVDSTAIVDLDMSGLVLRISSYVPVKDLLGVLAQAGCSVTAEQIVQLPSICCGGCSG